MQYLLHPAVTFVNQSIPRYMCTTTTSLVERLYWEQWVCAVHRTVCTCMASCSDAVISRTAFADGSLRERTSIDEPVVQTSMDLRGRLVFINA
jgi:hypothetical protein